MSDAPLLGTENASQVAFAGPYKPEKDDVVIEVTANPDGSYSLIDNNGKGFTAFFLDMGDGWYVVQQDFRKLADEAEVSNTEGGDVDVKVEEGQGPYLYNLAHRKGDDFWFYMPDCDEATEAVSGVTLESEVNDFAVTCKFSSAAALQEAAPNFIRRIDAGEYKDEPGILRSIANEPQ